MLEILLKLKYLVAKIVENSHSLRYVNDRAVLKDISLSVGIKINAAFDLKIRNSHN